ncbi:MAG: HDIG domain-containing protein [Spirochaetia bacterium]|nr:HDIG domain-containing protein [Spirochaetia bacterium]MCF7946343.1 HDIG domain-containing protein [Spirochaetia bacterium]
MKKTKTVNRYVDGMIIISLLSVLVISIFTPIFLQNQISRGVIHIPRGISVGEIADKDIIAEKSIFYIDKEATENAIEKATDKVKKVFYYSQDTTLRIINDFTLFAETINSENYDENSLNERIFSQFSRTELLALREISNSQRELVLSLSEEYIKRMLSSGIVSTSESLLIENEEMIEVSGPYQANNFNETDTISKNDLIIENEIDSVIEEYLENTGITSEYQKIIFDISRNFVEPNIFYDQITTNRRINQAANGIQPIIKEIEKGEILVKEGFFVNEEDYEKIQRIQEEIYSQPLVHTIAESLIIIFLYSVFFYIALLRIPNNFRKKQIIYILIGCTAIFSVLLLVLSYYSFFYNIGNILFFIPIALFGMMITILFNRIDISILLTSFLAILFGTIPEQTSSDVLLLAVIGTAAALLLKNAKRRIDIIKGIGWLLVLYIIITIIYIALDLSAFTALPVLLAVSTINILVTGLIILIVVPIFEHVLNLPTVFRLMELMEHDNKVMRRMVQVARGTHSHSVAVAELTEAACEAISANKLLAKVGAFYHDIGKIDQPEYFIENQSGANKHDNLKPSLSVAVIKSHVKIGIEKAKEVGLPKEVIEILAQHHGNDVISFFYMEALKKNGNTENITKEDFSYNGTPPLTREAAVVMLADSVDAASRTLKQPTTTKIDKLIWSIIMKKIENNQLNNCDLSIKDLEKIKESFLFKLTGRFHKRISYPDLPSKSQDTKEKKENQTMKKSRKS